MKSGMPAYDHSGFAGADDGSLAGAWSPPSGKEELLSRFRDEPIPWHGRCSLKSEACALQLAHAHNKILSLSNSRTRILAHQVESTHRIVNALHHRFILADEVGLG
ncbi:MAG TPA: hypothetical protein ENN21_05075, partial [Spirochaetes bacterium]|nr:hypothetical protein [Spirochaetota bacterium]